MADAQPWVIITAIAAQLAAIRTANGYLTDAGEAVWTEPAQRRDNVVGVSVATESITPLAGERPQKRGRALGLVIEAAIPVTLDNAHQLAHWLIADVEQALADFTSTQTNFRGPPRTLPIDVGDIAVLERPEGLAVIAVQIHVIARYWR
jgi:hypothetical protein